MEIKRKSDRLEFIKVLACIFVVVLHAVKNRRYTEWENTSAPTASEAKPVSH